MSTTPIKLLPPSLPAIPVDTPFPDARTPTQISFPWMNFLQQLNIVVVKLSRTPGPYADDAAAKAKGVMVGQQYYQASGAVVVRLT